MLKDLTNVSLFTSIYVGFKYMYVDLRRFTSDLNIFTSIYVGFTSEIMPEIMPGRSCLGDLAWEICAKDPCACTRILCMHKNFVNMISQA